MMLNGRMILRPQLQYGLDRVEIKQMYQKLVCPIAQMSDN